MTNRLSLKAFAVLAVMVALPASADAAFDCPAGSPAGDAAQAAEITALLGADPAFGDIGHMQETIDTLIGRGVSRTVIIDNLIGAYCPTVVAEAGLSDAQK